MSFEAIIGVLAAVAAGVLGWFLGRRRSSTPIVDAEKIRKIRELDERRKELERQDGDVAREIEAIDAEIEREKQEAIEAAKKVSDAKAEELEDMFRRLGY